VIQLILMRLQPVLFLSLLLMAACANDPKEPTLESTPANELISGADLVQQLRDNAIDENDWLGRLESSIQPIQEEFNASDAAMEEIKDVTVRVDGACNLVITNLAAGKVETRVNLHSLDRNNLKLIADNSPGEFPGIRVFTKGEQDLVETWVDGKLTGKSNELVIKMASRQSIERIAPVIIQTIYICQEMER
jgi:hypothetical protein